MAYKRNNRDYRGYENNKKTKERKERKVDTRGKRPSHVTVVPRHNEDPQRAIKRFLKKCKKERIVEKYREKEYYIKPSKKRRMEKKRREMTLNKLKNSNKNL
jgi:ribosomal protein S21